MQTYEILKRKLASGWNTWNVRSVLSHVWLGPVPDEDDANPVTALKQGVALNLLLQATHDGTFLKEAVPGREDIRLGAHASDGSYTDLSLRWNGIDVRVESARDGADLVVLVAPAAPKSKPGTLVVESGVLWNRPGSVQRIADSLVATSGDEVITVYATAAVVERSVVPTVSPFLAFSLSDEIGLSTGKRRTLSEIKAAIITRRAEQHRRRTLFGKLGDVYDAVQSGVAWNTIYDPNGDRVLTPTSRLLSVQAAGWQLNAQDVFYTALLAAVDSKELAYANVIEGIRQFVWEQDAEGFLSKAGFRLGFLPDVATAYGYVSLDRSNPPVGSFAVLELLKRFEDNWLAEAVFDELIAWNRWWADRRDNGGLLSWGSQAFEPAIDSPLEIEGVHDHAGAVAECGLHDAFPYDNVPFNKAKGLLDFGDVGLTALYIWDCDCLSEIATLIGRTSEAAELRARADRYRGHFIRFWSEEKGRYYNRRLDTNELDCTIWPTSFYALLGRVPSHDTVLRIINGHLNSLEFHGDWSLPLLSRRGPDMSAEEARANPIDARRNFLFYVALTHYDQQEVTKQVSARAEAVLLSEWRKFRHIHRQYSPIVTDECILGASDPFDAIGGVLGLIALMESNRE